MSHSSGPFGRKSRGPRKLPDLPQFYYHTHFTDVLNKVARRYASSLDGAPKQFISQFLALPRPAQCAYIRIAGRKGRVFNTAKLSYPEISNLPAQFETLKHAGFVKPLNETRTAEYLSVLTKAELTALMRQQLCASAFRASWAKARLIETALTHIPAEDLIASAPQSFIVQGRFEDLRYILYLYFGRIEDSLQPFTLRDLGLVKAPDFKDSYIWPAPQCNVSRAGRDELLSKLGGLSERLGDYATALGLYALSDTPHCNERSVRLRYSRNETGDRDAVKAQLEAMIEDPASDDEYHFAADYYARKFEKKRTSRVTDILRASEIIEIDEAYRHEPERAAACQYRDKGFDVYRTENAPWKMLFGLLFWDLLYGPEKSVLHNSFERLPANLKAATFYDDNGGAIENILSDLTHTPQILLQLLKITARHHGTPNGIFRWNSRTLDKVKTLIEAAPADSLAAMLRLMAKDWMRMKDGYPDLRASPPDRNWRGKNARRRDYRRMAKPFKPAARHTA